MSTEANKAIVRRYFEDIANAHRYDRVDELMSNDIEIHNSGLPAGTESIKHWLTMLGAAIPDHHMTIDDMIAEGDKVVVRVSDTGSHQGPFALPNGQSIPATGNRIGNPMAFIFRVGNGKIAEGWIFADNLALMQQLGVIPA